MVPFGGEETSSNGSMLLLARNRKEATALHLAAERGLIRGRYTKLIMPFEGKHDTRFKPWDGVSMSQLPNIETLHTRCLACSHER